MPEVTALFAGLMLLLQLIFGAIVSANRGKLGIALGDGGNHKLLQHIRVHGNFSEYVPMILIAMAIAELAGTSSGLLWLGGATLLVSRLVHAAATHGVGGAVGVGIGAGLNYLLLGVWGLYLIGHWAGIIPIL